MKPTDPEIRLFAGLENERDRLNAAAQVALLSAHLASGKGLSAKLCDHTSEAIALIAETYRQIFTPETSFGDLMAEAAERDEKYPWSDPRILGVLAEEHDTNPDRDLISDRYRKRFASLGEKHLSKIRPWLDAGVSKRNATVIAAFIRDPDSPANRGLDVVSDPIEHPPLPWNDPDLKTLFSEKLGSIEVGEPLNSSIFLLLGKALRQHYRTWWDRVSSEISIAQAEAIRSTYERLSDGSPLSEE